MRMRMVSRIPEYRSWVLTTSASKSPGSWGGRGEKHQQLHGQTPTHCVPTTLPVPPGQHRHQHGQESPGSHLLVVGFEAAHKEGVAPVAERPCQPHRTGDKASPATSGSGPAVTLLPTAQCTAWLPTLPTLTSPSSPPAPGVTAGTVRPRWEPCTAVSWCCSS